MRHSQSQSSKDIMKIIWFDFGGVLSPSIPDLFSAYFLKTGIPSSVLQHAMKQVADDMNMDVLAPIEKAIITESEWGSRLRKKIKQLVPDIDLSKARLEQFGEQWFDGIKPNQQMIDLFHMVKTSGLKVGILTNNVMEWEIHWKKVIGISEEADIIIDSCKVGYRKPEPEIFTIAAQRAGVRPEECLLIDDVLENCASAEQMGWKSIHFTDSDKAVASVISELQLKETIA